MPVTATAAVGSGGLGDLARPQDSDQLRATIRSCVPVVDTELVYGGLLNDGGIRLSAFAGSRTKGLHGLLVSPGRGLGGKVFATGRPEVVTNYASNVAITHDYDAPVLREGIRTSLAVPVVVAGRTRGLLYAATRSAGTIPDRVVDVMVLAAGRLAQRLRLEDEVDSRVRLLMSAPATTAAPTADVREAYRELRQIATVIDDPIVRARVLQVAQRLIGTTGVGTTGVGTSGVGTSEVNTPPRGTTPTGTAPTGGRRHPPLSPREIDVLAEVALGCTTKDIGDRLGLAQETVKAYLKSVNHKLGVSNRHQAVSRARRLGLLP